MLVFRVIVAIFRAVLTAKADLAIENLALRPQLIVLKRRRSHPRLRNRDRRFWLWLARSWECCRPPGGVAISRPDFRSCCIGASDARRSHAPRQPCSFQAAFFALIRPSTCLDSPSRRCESFRVGFPLGTPARPYYRDGKRITAKSFKFNILRPNTSQVMLP